MATKLKVTYADGHEITILASPRAQVMTERQYGAVSDEARRVEMSCFLAWASLSKAGKEPADFETWLDLVVDIAEAEAEEPRPTQPAPSGDTSSD